MFTNGLEGKEETEENLKYFKEALVFLGKEKMEYFESIGFILKGYENIIEDINKINVLNFNSLLYSLKLFKFLMILGFLNIPFYFAIENVYFKIIFLIMNSTIFTSSFLFFRILSISVKKKLNI
jgi:hypothetical protein